MTVVYTIYECDGRALRLRRSELSLGVKKAAANLKKHGISFEQACEVFGDRFFRLVDASDGDEARDAVIGMAEDWTVLFVVHVVRERGNAIRIISARRATCAERRLYEDND